MFTKAAARLPMQMHTMTDRLLAADRVITEQLLGWQWDGGGASVSERVFMYWKSMALVATFAACRQPQQPHSASKQPDSGSASARGRVSPGPARAPLLRPTPAVQLPQAGNRQRVAVAAPVALA
jgi:hypothetical protein